MTLRYLEMTWCEISGSQVRIRVKITAIGRGFKLYECLLRVDLNVVSFSNSLLMRYSNWPDSSTSNVERYSKLASQCQLSESGLFRKSA